MKGQTPQIVWFTGLSGSGKSTVANLIEKRLTAEGRHAYILDGDNVRHGLNKDLGFTDEARVENIRRVAEVARLMADAGLIVEFGAAFRFEHGLTGIEKDFGLEDETVADDADIRPFAEDGAQSSEEVGAIARQFLHALSERGVEPLAEIGDAGLDSRSRFSDASSASSSAASWRRKAEICWLSNSTCDKARAVSCFSLSSSVESSPARPCALAAPAPAPSAMPL